MRNPLPRRRSTPLTVECLEARTQPALLSLFPHGLTLPNVQEHIETVLLSVHGNHASIVIFTDGLPQTQGTLNAGGLIHIGGGNSGDDSGGSDSGGSVGGGNAGGGSTGHGNTGGSNSSGSNSGGGTVSTPPSIGTVSGPPNVTPGTPTGTNENSSSPTASKSHSASLSSATSPSATNGGNVAQAPSVLLPPDEGGRPMVGASPTTASAATSPAAIGPMAAAESGNAPAATYLYGPSGPSLPVSPMPREVDGTPPYLPEIVVAPEPREVAGAPAAAETAAATAPLALAQVQAEAVQTTPVNLAAEAPVNAGWSWEWFAGVGAALVAGGYWVIQKIRLARSTPAAFRRLPTGTILSTDVLPI